MKPDARVDGSAGASSSAPSIPHLATLPLGGAALTVGTFDGVHRGHHDVLARLAARARRSGLRSVLVTFEPHPSEVLKPERAPLMLTPGDEKLAALAESGIDYAVILPFTRGLAALSAEHFVEDVLLPRFGMRELVVGYDHGFGRDRAGGVDVLRELGERRGFPVEVVPPYVLLNGETVSSTMIRAAVSEGDLERAAEALGRPYSVIGRVAQGEGRGRVLGYPTINVALSSPRKLLPPAGVYAVRVETPAGAFGGMMNLGPRPTFGDGTLSLEAHLFDADVKLYHRSVRITFVRWLRETRRFDGPEALVQQLGRDALDARAALARSR
jgi:riboflavin kinase/FMN adenylyltransferase